MSGDPASLLVELKEREVLAAIRESLERGEDPLSLVESLREGMEEVGRRFERKEYYLSELIMSAEIFKEAVDLMAHPARDAASRSECGQGAGEDPARPRPNRRAEPLLIRVMQLIFPSPPVMPGVGGEPPDGQFQFVDRTVMGPEEYLEIVGRDPLRWAPEMMRLSRPEPGSPLEPLKASVTHSRMWPGPSVG